MFKSLDQTEKYIVSNGIKKRIFAINLGSTSTKIAYYENEECIIRDTITHSSDDIKKFKSVFDQAEMRSKTILQYMSDNSISMEQLDAFVSSGGMTEPIVGGTYKINEAMLAQIESGKYGVHVCSVGCRIAYDITKDHRALPLTANTPTTDEFEPIARYSGLKEISRVSCIQALNHKAMANYYAHSIGKRYDELNLIVVMLGGGISVVAHRKGLMVDGPDALEGEGPFSNNRCCTVPIGQLIKLCYSGEYDYKSMMRHINGEAGLVAYLGTTDIREILQRIQDGDTYAEEVLNAMCYQTAKDIGAYATVLKGEVDAILLVGGMANSEFITDHIIDRVKFISPVVILPGEREMESLCLSAYEALNGRTEIKEFVPMHIE